MVYLSLGTNLGDREANLERAIQLLNASDIQVLRRSSCYETAPRDVLDQPWFLNMAVECRTLYPPVPLMNELLRLEKQMGRDRSVTAVHRGPRLIDIDMLLYADTIIKTPELTVPHPRMLERRFVLEPLIELAPDLKNPGTARPLREALALVQSQTLTRLR